MVLLDGAPGEIISKDGRKIISSDGAGAGFPWKDGLSVGGSKGENGGRAAPSNREAARAGPGAVAPLLQKQDSLDDAEAQIMQQVIEQSLREQEEIERAIQLSLSGGGGSSIQKYRDRHVQSAGGDGRGGLRGPRSLPAPPLTCSINFRHRSGEEAVKPAPPPYKKLDVELGPPPAYESLEAKSK